MVEKEKSNCLADKIKKPRQSKKRKAISKNKSNIQKSSKPTN